MAVDWRPVAVPEVLQRRALLNACVRDFFARRGVLEVETPQLSAAAATDPQLASLPLALEAGQPPRWLHTSPEFPMKRLLAAGSGPIYQMAHVFRGGESGRWHNPEFTLLEWYRPGFGMAELMQELRDLIAAVAVPQGRPPPEATVITYSGLFEQEAGVAPLTATAKELQDAAARLGLAVPGSLRTREDGLDLLLSLHIQPRLKGRGLLFVERWPAAQAALARLCPEDARVACRFEAFLDGVEIANGFHELGDAAEQRRRFEADNAARAARGLPAMPLDERLLAALAAGLPDCSGVALGLDRLLMWLCGARHLDEVLAFPARLA
jgi:lysyl-tRNA synthetase class 2